MHWHPRPPSKSLNCRHDFRILVPKRLNHDCGGGDRFQLGHEGHRDGVLFNVINHIRFGGKIQGGAFLRESASANRTSQSKQDQSTHFDTAARPLNRVLGSRGDLFDVALAVFLAFGLETQKFILDGVLLPFQGAFKEGEANKLHSHGVYVYGGSAKTGLNVQVGIVKRTEEISVGQDAF